MIIILIPIIIKADIEWLATVIICVCNNISDSQIREAISSGVASMAELQAQLSVSSQCGTCFESAEEVLFECLRTVNQNPGLFYSAA